MPRPGPSRPIRILIALTLAASLLPSSASAQAGDCGQYRWYVYTSPASCPSAGENCRLELARFTPSRIQTLTGVRVLGSYRTEADARQSTRAAMGKAYSGTTSSGCKATVNGALYDVRNFVAPHDCQSTALGADGDEDDDGAPDKVDTCRGTPGGTLVDWWGCPCQAPPPTQVATACAIDPVVAPSCPAAPQVSSEQIDRFMDYLAAQIQFAHERASTPWVVSSSRAVLDDFTMKMAADLGLAVWHQAHALERMHMSGEITLNEQQKLRTKVLGHWAGWLSYRANYYRTFFEDPMVGAGMGERMPPSLGPPPTYPLYGPISGPIPTPPQLVGEPPEIAAAEEYTWAAVVTTAEIVDLWYFRGIFHSLYLAYQGHFSGAFVTGVVMNMPYAGKALMAANVLWAEANGAYQYYETGENPLTWDQHIANIAAGTNLAISAYKTAQLRNLQANVQRGIDEGYVSPDVKARIGNGNKSFKEVGQGAPVEVEINCEKYQAEPVTVEYAVVGKYQGKSGNAPFDVKTASFLRVRDADGGYRYYQNNNNRPGEPIFFVGEKGYHLWKHLTEQNAGYETGFPSLLQTFAGNPKYTQALAELQAMARDPGSSLGAANTRYVQDFVNPLIHDPTIKKVTGYYMFQSQDGKLSAPEANFFPLIPCNNKGTAATYPVRVAVDPSSGGLKNVFVLNPLNPGQGFAPNPNLVNFPIDWARLTPNYYNYPLLAAFLPAEGAR